MHCVALWRCSALCVGMRRGFIGSLLFATALFAFSHGQAFADEGNTPVQTPQVTRSPTEPTSGQSNGTILEGVTVDGIDVFSVDNQWVVAGRLIIVTFEQYQYLALEPLFLELGAGSVAEVGPKEMIVSVDYDVAAMKAMQSALQGVDGVDLVIFDSNVVVPVDVTGTDYVQDGAADELAPVGAVIYLAGGGLAAAVAGVALMTRRRSPATAATDPA